MACRADAADARCDAAHFPHHAAFAELLEAAEFVHVEARILDDALFIQLNGDLCVSLDARDGVDRYGPVLP